MMGHFMKSFAVLSLVIMMISFEVSGAVADRRKTQKQAVPAIFVFGDETMDVGNNNYFPPGDAERADYLYYGIDFPFPNGNQPTGRFSNGYIMADFVAMAMGFNMSPPAFMSLTSPIKMENGFTGVNYASAGAGIWNLTATIGDDVAIPLLKQVDNFAATIGQMQGSQEKRKPISKLLSRSFFLISIGANDVFTNYRLRQNRRTPFANQTSPQNLASYMGAAITCLYEMGARKFGIVNVPPFECVPTTARCNGMNSIAREFNDGLKLQLASLKSSSLHDLRYSIADFYAFTNATLMNPSAHGFVKDIYSACCSNPCYQGNSPAPCDNRKQYWFWDGTNPTEKAFKLSTAAFYDGPPKFTVPINFKRLIHEE